MADKFLQNSGIEAGYFAKRRDQFNSEIANGLKFATNKPASVTAKKKSEKAVRKQPVTDKLDDKKDLASTPPNQLTGQDFVERMRLAREAKAKNNA